MAFLRLILTVFFALIAYNTPALAAEPIRAAGSSTIYPFISEAAHHFSMGQKYKTPVVESIGTGGGFMLFCSGESEYTTDIANASRRIKPMEESLCKTNGVTYTELTLGYDGIIFANSSKRKNISFTKHQLFLALAAEVPVNGKLVRNPYRRWKDIDPSLPNDTIVIYGPPHGSGTRDTVEELILAEVCQSLPEFQATYPNAQERSRTCKHIRDDGVYITTSEQDNITVSELQKNPKAIGIFGFSLLSSNPGSIQGSPIDGTTPSYNSIHDGSYPMSRSLYLYYKPSHKKTTPGLKEFMAEIFSEQAGGENGYLREKGLVPLPEEKLAEMRLKL